MSFRTITNECSVGLYNSVPTWNHTRFYKHVDTLSESQKSFISLLNAWFESDLNEIILITGSPGSGKTYLIFETLKHINADILKMAPTAKIALKIGGFTIHSALRINFNESSLFKKITSDIEKLDDEDDGYILKTLNISKEVQKCMACYRNPDIIVIDEIGMVPFWLTHEIIQYFSVSTPKLFILIGDEYQLKPVKCNFNIFNTKILDLKKIHLEDNKRFTADYNSIINYMKKLMDEGDVSQFLDYISNTYPILDDVYEFTLKKCNRVLVYRNETVEKYNNFYIENLPGPKIIIPKILNGVVYKQDNITLKTNCDIFITRNCVVPNGTFLNFMSHNLDEDLLICKSSNSSVYVNRDQFGQFPVTVGFANTIHKFQGETINENVLFDFDKCAEMNLIYTALSRVRSMDQILGIKW